MEQLFLMPGEERYERFKDGNGVPKVHYSYRSMRGAFFDCESRSLEEAQRLCENWPLPFCKKGCKYGRGVMVLC